MSAAPPVRQLVFAYGSLLIWGAAADRRAVRARVDGFRRVWNVAMDNAIDVPGYKYYRHRDGDRPVGFVTFLNLMPAAGHHVNGVAVEVTELELRELDARERNYDRHDITAWVRGASPGTVWTYVGSADARGRYEAGLAAGRAVVSREYYEAVLRGFDALGPEAAAEFAATTDLPACPIRDLTRVDLPQSLDHQPQPQMPSQLTAPPG